MHRIKIELKLTNKSYRRKGVSNWKKLNFFQNLPSFKT